MASRTRQITEKIRDLIAVDFTSGESGIDMQNTVQIGATIEPPYVPFACVSFSQAASEYGQSLGRYKITNTFEIYAFVGGADVEERTINAMDLVEDMIQALCADRQIGLSSIVDDIKCAFLAEDGDRYGIEGIGIGYIEVQVYSQSDTGI
tara:strand:+ start:4378 stop:4827 length:450 start_codon:yes stop_codon:yes gene_type:complete